MSHGPQAFFLPAAPGQRYALYHAPADGPVRGLVLYCPPFAEELNKTRRMAALQARALAQAGFAVLQLDLLGCGDSDGDFADARWDIWLHDLRTGLHWLQQHHPVAPAPWLWGLRAGCLLAADLARSLDRECRLLFWQPAFGDGGQQLQQFLRLRLAASMLNTATADAAPAAPTMAALHASLAAGTALDVAGYTLAPALAASLQASRLSPPAPARPSARLYWLEVTSRPDATPSPLATRTLAAWQAAGWQARARALPGPAFWQSAEIEEAPALLAATTAALCEEYLP
ncbi:hydrolase 2, exosortase A system-associated [Pseudorhodoferax sp.]|uniref:hydrolase 2, exosortase A system-associated n=1 Tax=Pseudorhodoferax sp. TaxID=1993553 RepID=UPI0039E4AC53